MSSGNPNESPRSNEAAGGRAAGEFHRTWKGYSPAYDAAFKTALILQAVLALVSALVLDFGHTHRPLWVAFLCQWVTVWVILLRRPLNPAPVDLALVRYGSVLLLGATTLLGPTLLRILGASV